MERCLDTSQTRSYSVQHLIHDLITQCLHFFIPFKLVKLSHSIPLLIRNTIRHTVLFSQWSSPSLLATRTGTTTPCWLLRPDAQGRGSRARPITSQHTLLEKGTSCTRSTGSTLGPRMTSPSTAPCMTSATPSECRGVREEEIEEGR